MKKVLILTNNDVGLFKFRREIIQELVKKYEVYISLPFGEFVVPLVEMGCRFIETTINRRGTNPVADLKLILRYKEIINEIKPDVVLTYTIKPNVYGGIVCRMFGIPYISNITGLGTAVENKGLLQWITLILYKTSLKNSGCVFFQNEENMEFFKRNKIINGTHKLIPGSGVNLEYFTPIEYPSDNTIDFLFIARVMKEKGIDQYLEAARYIKEKYPFTTFHILGYCEQDYEDKLEELEKKGIIKYHGLQSDVREFLKFSHCTIHPTYYPEGMSNVLLESAASGRPIITTDRSGCREIIDDGINGYIVKQQNSNDLIGKIEKFLKLDNSERKKMGKHGRGKVENEFDREIIIREYLVLINKLVNKKLEREKYGRNIS